MMENIDRNLEQGVRFRQTGFAEVLSVDPENKQLSHRCNICDYYVEHLEY